MEGIIRLGRLEADLISKDGWTWNPWCSKTRWRSCLDVGKIGDRYLVVYGATGGGTGGGWT